MISKLIGDKGGMHGRVNRQIYLRPFTLQETEKFLQSKGFDWSRYQIAETYMIMGGIPYYLDMLDASLSPNQNIDYLFFHEGVVCLIVLLKPTIEKMIFLSSTVAIKILYNLYYSQFHNILRIYEIFR